MACSKSVPFTGLNEAFKGLDKDGDGALNLADLRGLLEDLKMIFIRDGCAERLASVEKYFARVT
eukprot:4645521-Amphidinium_carterae.1